MRISDWSQTCALPIWLLIIEHVDFMRVDELCKFKRLLAFQLHRFRFFGIEQHIAALLIFEAFQNLVRIDRPYAGHNLFIFDGFPRWFVYLPKGNLSAAFGGRIDFHCYVDQRQPDLRSEEHTSELQSLM